MTRLPEVGGDDGNWGAILNDYLTQAHAPDGSLKTGTVGTRQLEAAAVSDTAIADGAVRESKLHPDVRSKLKAAPAIANGSITEMKLGDRQVTRAKLADGAVGSGQLEDGAIAVEKLRSAGEADGVATLDSAGHLPEAQIPSRLTSEALDATYATLLETNRWRVDLSSGSVTLTPAQAVVHTIDLVNATATVVVSLPTPCAVRIRNATNFSQLIKRVGSTRTISLDSGTVAEVYS